MKRSITFLILVTFILTLSCKRTDKSNEEHSTAEKIQPSQNNPVKSIAADQPNEDFNKINIWKQIENKAQWFEQGRTIYKDLDSINQEFNSFYQQFIIDSTYQIEHVDFPIVAAIGYCESTIELDQSNWEFISYELKNNPNDSRYTYEMISTNNVFYLRTSLTEIGTISQIGFEKIDNQWYLTLYSVNAC